MLHLTVVAPPDLAEHVKARARAEDRPVSNLIRVALAEYLAKHDDDARTRGAAVKNRGGSRDGAGI